MGMRVSDFETVRRGLWWYPAPQRKVDAREALDRIEAEVERLRAENDILRDVRGYIDSEGRTVHPAIPTDEANYREAFEADEKTIAELQAEVERLRAALEFIAEHPSIAADSARNTLAEEKV